MTTAISSRAVSFSDKLLEYPFCQLLELNKVDIQDIKTDEFRQFNHTVYSYIALSWQL